MSGAVRVEERVGFSDPPGTTQVTDPAVLACVLEGLCPECRVPLLEVGRGWWVCSNHSTRFSPHRHWRIRR